MGSCIQWLVKAGDKGLTLLLQLRTTLQRTLKSQPITAHLLPCPILLLPLSLPLWLLIPVNLLHANRSSCTDIIILILPVRKLRLRDVKCLAHHHCTADEWQFRASGWLGQGCGEVVRPQRRPVQPKASARTRRDLFHLPLPIPQIGKLSSENGKNVSRFVMSFNDGPRCVP